MDTQYLRAPGAGEGVTLGDLALPGVVTSIEVRGQYEIEKKKVQGLSGTTKMGHGYNDAQVTITLEILPPNEFAQVKQIERAFKATFGAAGKPKPMRVVNPLLDSKDVYSVLFVNFAVRQGNEDDSLLATLELLEFEPLARIQDLKHLQRVPVGRGPKALPIPNVVATYTPPGLGDYFDAGLNTGTAVASGAPPPLPPALADIVAGGPLAKLLLFGPK